MIHPDICCCVTKAALDGRPPRPAAVEGRKRKAAVTTTKHWHWQWWHGAREQHCLASSSPALTWHNLEPSPQEESREREKKKKYKFSLVPTNGSALWFTSMSAQTYVKVHFHSLVMTNNMFSEATGTLFIHPWVRVNVTLWWTNRKTQCLRPRLSEKQTLANFCAVTKKNHVEIHKLSKHSWSRMTGYWQGRPQKTCPQWSGNVFSEGFPTVKT